MRIKTIETLGSTVEADDDSVVVLQKFCHRHRRVRSIALALCGGLLALPFGLVWADPSARVHFAALMTSDAGAVLQLAIVFVIALTAGLSGLITLCLPLVTKRVIHIDHERVTVEDTVRGRNRLWYEPIQAYRGIRHRIMTTSAGAVHTLSLEHPLPDRSLCIAYETRISNQAMIDASGRYQLPILAADPVTLGDRITGVIVQWLSEWLRATDGGRRAAST